MNPLISICIPAYKRVHYLKRLLDSISIQSFKNYEVVITDDSNDKSVADLVEQYKNHFFLRYQKNPVALGTPENWNESIRLAAAPWIKLMHDDDWFGSADALQQFADATGKEHDFIFSAYFNCYEARPARELVVASRMNRNLLQTDPFNLVSTNMIGPPSVTLYRRNAIEYDKRMKWRVDIDFYIQFLRNASFHFIKTPLINVGISEEQVTQSCFLVPEVEIPENFLLLEKMGISSLNNWIVYDSWWRLMRNLNIKNITEISKAGYVKPVPPVIKRMIRQQRLVSARLLKIGVLSKTLMFISWTSWRLFHKGEAIRHPAI
jgi:glycosyltransferase involved in cell wall biosynthesis